MWIRNLFDYLKPGRCRTPVRPAPCRLSVEALDDRIVPAAMLSVGDATIVEGFGGTVAEVVVTLSEPSNRTVQVNYKTTNGTALAGYDYQAASGKLTFAPGETTKTILVPVIGDGFVESDETFFVELSRARHANIADGRSVVAIVDDGVDNYYVDHYVSYDSGGYGPYDTSGVSGWDPGQSW